MRTQSTPTSPLRFINVKWIRKWMCVKAEGGNCCWMCIKWLHKQPTNHWSPCYWLRTLTTRPLLLFLRKPLFVNGEMESLMGRLVFGCYITSLCIFTLQWNWLEPLSNSRSLGHSVFYEWMTVCILFPWVFYIFSSFFPQSKHGGLDHWTDRGSDVKVTGHLFLFVVLGPITDVSGCSMENVSLPGLPAVQIYFVLKISKAVILKVGGTFF